MHARRIAQIADSRRHLRRGSGSLTYRRAKKKSKKPNSHREIKISRKGPLFLMMLFFVSQYFFLQSSLFQVSDVVVEGNEVVPLDSIRANLGLSEHTRFWEVSPQTLKGSVLELHRLQDAEVAMAFPGRVRVKVQERAPAFSAAALGSERQWYAVDRDGVILNQRAPEKGAFKVLLDRPLRVGTQLSAKELEVILYFQKSLKPSLRQRLRTVKLNKRHEVALKISFKNKYLWVRLGRPEKMGYKLFLLEELLNQLKKERSQVASVDLRYSTPVVRLAKPAVPDSL